MKIKLPTEEEFAQAVQRFSEKHDVSVDTAIFTHLNKKKPNKKGKNLQRDWLHKKEFSRILKEVMHLPDEKCENILKLQESCYILLKNIYASPFTTDTVLSYIDRYNKMVKKVCGDGHITLAFLKGDPNHYRERSQRNNNMVKRRNSPKNRKDFEGINEYLDKARSLLSSNNFYDKSLGIFILTGRRPAEVMVTGNFSHDKDKTYRLMFSGQVKTKGEEVSPYSIPVLADSETILNAHKIACKMDVAARNELLSMDKTAIKNGTTWESLIDKKMGCSLRKHFKDEFTGFFKKRYGSLPKLYACRHIYMAICTRLFKHPRGNESDFYKDLFQHGGDKRDHENDATHAYKDYIIPDNEKIDLVIPEDEKYPDKKSTD